MKISYSKAKTNNKDGFSVPLGNSFLNVSDTKFVTRMKNGTKELIWEGEIYYHVNGEKNIIISRSEQESFLEKQLENFNVSSFINSVEGIYSAVYIDNEKKSAVIFCDYLNRKNFFYSEFVDRFVVSTSLDTIIPEFTQIKYNQTGLLSYLALGYTPIYETFYEGIERLNTNEYLVIKNENIYHELLSENYLIEEYDESHLEKYDELISTAVASRSSSVNYILNSGGWDSTAILYLLSKNHKADKINSVIYLTKLSDGSIYNVYEAEKVKKISEYYGVKSEQVEIDYSDKSLVDDMSMLKDDMKKYHSYFFVDMPKTIAKVSNENKGCSVFSGEASDSIHNFGFSQFVSVSYEDKKLREYADKMKNYLYGPTFYNKVLNNSFANDDAFKFFEFYFGKDKFENTTKIKDELLLFSYLKSFMFPGGRVPFYKSGSSSFSSIALNIKFNKNITEKIFSPVISKINPQNLYYCLLQMYRSYHFHSPQIAVKHTPLRKHGENCKLPFLDMRMVKFMYSMPESWGRGLESRETKYPLKQLAHTKWNFPVHILESTKAHSYISEHDKKWSYSGGKWNINCEVVYKSSLGEHYKKVLSEINLEKFFSPQFFEVDTMKKIIIAFINGKQDLENADLIYNLGVLFSIGLYE